ncbi:MAG: cation:proton antiporter [Gammaproteobacteria bacterium]|nr:cation:proton antiporter [Gammaproteobacteria bacterium]
MDFSWIAINHSTTAVIALVFITGFLARLVNLPPLVGFLIAGFIIKAVGVTTIPGLNTLADLGITLLLFTIGLKLNIRSLTRPDIWATSSLHMLLIVGVFGGILMLISYISIPMLADVNLQTATLLAFALSFSSTIFAVKVLEEKGELKSSHGRISIGILIMQDIFAVTFLTISSGKIPSWWALVVLAGLLLLRPLMIKIIRHCGRGELLIITGFILALSGASLFEMVNLKADLGALVMGMILARSERASEMAAALLSFKDIFLIGFFLSIGLSASINADVLMVAVVLLLIMPLKVAALYWLFSLFRLRARTSFLSSISLANYSEFGLIVSAIGYSNGWLSSEWLGVMAVAMSLTFIVASPFNISSHKLYLKLEHLLTRFQRDNRLPSEQVISTGHAEILVFGMGRVGTSAYDTMRHYYGDIVMGVDNDAIILETHKKQGRNVILGDATDPEFWDKFRPEKVKVILLDMPKPAENLFAFQLFKARGFRGHVAATAKFDDQVEMLKSAGIDAAFNIYGEAGAGFANHVRDQIFSKLQPPGADTNQSNTKTVITP